MTFFESHLPGGGPPTLSNLSVAEATEKYKHLSV
ncbi:hypothetical protein FOE74_12000 [Rufibacter glacialis]|uniref:Uncharacterized protein n=1 Tax=Rufibacter glacialis TaxID=1259555 RepID=A0A5M8QE14_9BACT|nr:hypothetical protein FOE74_12000 [Rufibacter glacialis]